MKKLVFAAALALCAAANAEIASSTTVGYTTKTLEAGKWYLIGAGFEGVGTELTVQNFVSGLTASGDTQTAPTIQYWNGTKLETLYYLDGVLDSTWTPVVAWANYDGSFADLSVNPGWGCWIKVPTATTITLSGQVVNAETKELTLTSSWQLAGNPFPVATGVNSATMDCSGLTASSDTQTAPTIQYWDGAKLVTLYYFNGVLDSTWTPVVAWADSKGNFSDVSLDPCTGFWVKSPTGGKITWKK